MDVNVLLGRYRLKRDTSENFTTPKWLPSLSIPKIVHDVSKRATSRSNESFALGLVSSDFPAVFQREKKSKYREGA